MNTEATKVSDSLRKLFPTASNIFVDTQNKECEVHISVDDFRGIINEKLFEDGVQFLMIDYWDNLPFKYIFEYKTRKLK